MLVSAALILSVQNTARLSHSRRRPDCERRDLLLTPPIRPTVYYPYRKLQSPRSGPSYSTSCSAILSYENVRLKCRTWAVMCFGTHDIFHNFCPRFIDPISVSISLTSLYFFYMVPGKYITKLFSHRKVPRSPKNIRFHHSNCVRTKFIHSYKTNYIMRNVAQGKVAKIKSYLLFLLNDRPNASPGTIKLLLWQTYRAIMVIRMQKSSCFKFWSPMYS